MNGGDSQAAIRHLRGIVNHWNEFGAEHGLDELMHYAYEWLKQADVPTQAMAQFHDQRAAAVKRFDQ